MQETNKQKTFAENKIEKIGGIKFIIMKKLQLNKEIIADLESREMNELKGGCVYTTARTQCLSCETMLSCGGTNCTCASRHYACPQVLEVSTNLDSAMV